ncbi:carbon catabolit repression protein [Streptomyces sodiiphilus]|uniref:Carbon catabolit repression protein n=1 Tax=Streptomyces sodiiphilus TaxID=226217 RepID=A0ABN2PVD0_9ACTN
MSDSTEHPDRGAAGARPGEDPTGHDSDAWARACEEDLAAESARHRERHDPPPADLTEELRRLAGAVTEGLGRLGLDTGPLAGRVQEVLGPVLLRNPEVAGHLARAGGELLAAYRAAVSAHERDWTRPPAPRGPQAGEGGETGDRDAPGGGPAPTRIDLD